MRTVNGQNQTKIEFLKSWTISLSNSLEGAKWVLPATSLRGIHYLGGGGYQRQTLLVLRKADLRVH